MARSGVVNVYIKENSPRAAWIFKLIFEELLGLQLQITNDPSVFATGETPALNYSDDEIPGSICIRPAGLLSEEGVNPQEIKVLEHDGVPVFFQTEGGDLPFDPFAMSFYLVSRYEEHLPFEADRHGRFSSDLSLAKREGFLEMAVVNRLAILLRDHLLNKYPESKFDIGEYKFIPTVDIDIAYAHLGKGFVRAYGAMAKHLLKADFGEVSRRIRSMRGKTKDPYDNFDLFNGTCQEHALNPIYFILAGDPGPHDRNLSLNNKNFAELVKSLSDKNEIGVHPSYGSDNDTESLKKELGRILTVTGKVIEKSRQHFVRLRFPDTYAMLINNGIKEDYSMGYADAQGFRASIASPYKYYDLSEEKETSLTVFPFMFMDSTLSDYMNLSPEKYGNSVAPLIEEVKYCKGTLVGIWHNYAMADNKEKLKAFKEIINQAVSS